MLGGLGTKCLCFLISPYIGPDSLSSILYSMVFLISGPSKSYDGIFEVSNLRACSTVVQVKSGGMPSKSQREFSYTHSKH